MKLPEEAEHFPGAPLRDPELPPCKCEPPWQDYCLCCGRVGDTDHLAGFYEDCVEAGCNSESEDD